VSDWDDEPTPVEPIEDHIRRLEASLQMAEATCRELRNDRARLLLEIKRLKEQRK
jgi:hypothetical protein